MNQPPHNPFEPPPAGSYGGPPGGAPTVPASSEAIASLVCGVLALSCFPLGIIAFWLGVRARRAIRENPGRIGGDSLALAGMIVGAIFVGLWFLYFAAIIVMMMIAGLKR